MANWKTIGIRILKFIAAGAGLLTVVAIIAGVFALNPDEIFKDERARQKPTAVKLAEPPKQEAPPEPPPQKTEASLLASLAPDSFANQDLGAGVSFGSGGNGPAVGGGGGFGTDAGQLVKERASINRPPRIMMKGQLEYPSEARQRNISGFVILKILVAETGVVQNVEVEESEPRGVFDQAAMRSVKGWKFEPAMIKGQIVAAWTSQKIKFELN
jgi:protein TonB